jgi:hypothetical protein
MQLSSSSAEGSLPGGIHWSNRAEMLVDIVRFGFFVLFWLMGIFIFVGIVLVLFFAQVRHLKIV